MCFSKRVHAQKSCAYRIPKHMRNWTGRRPFTKKKKGIKYVIHMIRYYSRSETQTINIILPTHVPLSALLLRTNVNSSNNNNKNNWLYFMVRVVQNDRFIIVWAIYYFCTFSKNNFSRYIYRLIICHSRNERHSDKGYRVLFCRFKGTFSPAKGLRLVSSAYASANKGSWFR